MRSKAFDIQQRIERIQEDLATLDCINSSPFDAYGRSNRRDSGETEIRRPSEESIGSNSGSDYHDDDMEVPPLLPQEYDTPGLPVHDESYCWSMASRPASPVASPRATRTLRLRFGSTSVPSSEYTTTTAGAPAGTEADASTCVVRPRLSFQNGLLDMCKSKSIPCNADFDGDDDDASAHVSPYLLNFVNGVLDTRTSKFIPCNADFDDDIIVPSPAPAVHKVIRKGKKLQIRVPPTFRLYPIREDDPDRCECEKKKDDSESVSSPVCDSTTRQRDGVK